MPLSSPFKAITGKACLENLVGLFLDSKTATWCLLKSTVFLAVSSLEVSVGSVGLRYALSRCKYRAAVGLL